MDILKVLYVFFLSALAVLASVSADDHHKEGTAHGGHSHVSVSHHKHGNYEYKIEHEKHGAHHGSSHPHGYGGYGRR